MTIQVLTKLKRNEGLSWDGQRLIAHVKASPAKGAANNRLLSIIAGWLDVELDSVSIQKGHTARVKVVEVDISADKLQRAIAEVPAPPKQLRISKNP